MTFQELILALQNYWANHGCIIQQPYDTEKGAGTFHPATFLRALGPEPWNVAYVEPSRRPTDPRRGNFGRRPIPARGIFGWWCWSRRLSLAKARRTPRTEKMMEKTDWDRLSVLSCRP